VDVLEEPEEEGVLTAERVLRHAQAQGLQPVVDVRFSHRHLELCGEKGTGDSVRGPREEPDEVQQGQVQGPAPGEEQPQAPVKAGADLLESSSVERDWECWGTTG